MTTAALIIAILLAIGAFAAVINLVVGVIGLRRDRNRPDWRPEPEEMTPRSQEEQPVSDNPLVEPSDTILS